MPDFVSVNDSRIQTRILKGDLIKRETFNPSSKSHRESLHNYLTTGNWGSVQFFAEAPYVTVPETVLRKMAEAAIKKLNR